MQLLTRFNIVNFKDDFFAIPVGGSTVGAESRYSISLRASEIIRVGDVGDIDIA